MTRSSGTSRACAAGIGWRGAPPVKATRGATLSAREIWLQQVTGLGQMVPQRPLHRRICQSAVTGWAVTCGAGGRRPGVGVRLRAAPQALGRRSGGARHRRLRGVLCWRRPHLQVKRQVLLGSVRNNSSQQVTSLITCAVPAVTLVNCKSLTTSATHESIA
jgi:hypothetical protein